MKKLLAIILTVCMVVGVCCAATLGGAAASSNVLRISGQQKDGSLAELKSTADFTEGWNYAMELAVNHDWMSDNHYVRIVVDLLTDWNAVDGEFSEDGGVGFKWGTIFIEEEAIITLNLNGHTINRGLTDWEYNGEVISIDDEADVIINGGKDAADTQTGTITGGFSCNGGGGIHVEDDVKITLNNVNVVKNAVEDDSGSAIHVLDGSKLTMNGGSIANNRLTMGSFTILDLTYGTVYIEDADATFNKVTFSGNICQNFHYEGAAVYVAGDSDVTLNECIVENHGQNATDSEDGSYLPYSLFYSFDEDSDITLNKCTVRNNRGRIGGFVTGGKTVVNECTFTGNDVAGGLFRMANNNQLNCEVKNCTFTDNPGPVNAIDSTAIQKNSKLIFTSCSFNQNGTGYDYSIMGDPRAEVKLAHCELGDTVLKNKEHIAIVNTEEDEGIGSVIGEGSLTTIVAFLALFFSIGALGVIVATNKKKAAASSPDKAAANEEDEDE